MKKVILLLTAVLLSLSIEAVAQEMKTHTVGKGETIESVAKRYKVSVAQLLEANPGIENLFVPGVKVRIPEVGKASSTSSNSGDLAASEAYSTQPDPYNEVLSFFSAFYHSSFKKAFSSRAPVAYYGVGGTVVSHGVNTYCLVLQLGLDYGLRGNYEDRSGKKQKLFGAYFNIGGGYAYRFSEKSVLTMPVTLDLSSQTVVSSITGDDKTALFWGFSVLPTLNYEIAPKLWASCGLNLDVYFSRKVKIKGYEEKIKHKPQVGFQVGLGYVF